MGSGSGTTWLLEECCRHEGAGEGFDSWLAKEKRILIHAGGQGRRLPAYAVTGKTKLPIPVFRWARGQKLRQDLLSLQVPLLEQVMRKAPDSLRTLIASGDVLIRTDEALQEIPEADVVCYGTWVDASVASRHGVFAARRDAPDLLDKMLQKPSPDVLEALSRSHLVLMDIGVWLLSDRAVKVLRKRSRDEKGELRFYDLYSDFGRALGTNPEVRDEEVNGLSVRILPLPGGEFYHYGTTREMIESTLALQNRVHDQRLIMHRKIKPNPAIFTQNAVIDYRFTERNRNIWIENAYLGKGWTVSEDNAITGVPPNDWRVEVRPGVCIDVVPVDEDGIALRPYGMDDLFRGDIYEGSTGWMGRPLRDWAAERGIALRELEGDSMDIQQALLFPVLRESDLPGEVLNWMIDAGSSPLAKDRWLKAERLSADELMVRASSERLFAQREALRRENYKMLERNHEKSVFYQLDLSDVAAEYSRMELDAPEVLPEGADGLQRMHNRMVRSRILGAQGHAVASLEEEQAAFDLLRKGMIESLATSRGVPSLAVSPDQIVWGRSPVRIDLAGGWTDTPPFSLYAGGNVVNVAIELNGQPPLQVYVKPCAERHIVLRSIDMGASEVVETYEQLGAFHTLRSPFSIPKAALALCGFLPAFSTGSWGSLNEQLEAFGSGIELTLLAAIPAGSGLGTSSILASTVLGGLNDFCGLNWSKQDISTNTLVLEQLLTSGGGWQDQYGGIFHGVKLLQSARGFVQQPEIIWLPDFLFTDEAHRSCHLLYYTGITRVAKGILGEIARGMFLNSGSHLSILHEMKGHALDMARCIQRGDFERYGKLVLATWEQKKRIDGGTNPPEVEGIIDLIRDYTLGYKLPGAGGGGYLYMVAKDPDAAARIKKVLNEKRPNDKARFVDMCISHKGFQVSRS